MSEWLMSVKAYALKNNISYKQALKDALHHLIKHVMKR